MPNTNFQALVQSQFDLFRKSYLDSKEIFKNDKVKNNLLHSGEYGAYRENLCKKLIETSIPRKFSISDGFLINSYDQISNQIDLIIYDQKETPLIRLGDDSPRFFPVETVLSIGEVKSSLTTKDLCKALVKLSDQKRIRTGIMKDTFCLNEPDVEPNFLNSPFDNLFSFIVCEKISDFKASSIESQILKAYRDNNVPSHLRHNIIFSLKDGLLGYKPQESKFSNDVDATIADSFLYFPSILGEDFKYSLKVGKDADKNFLICISNFLTNARIYYPEPSKYI